MQVRFFDTILLLILVVLASACNDKICPAYSSYFILDNSKQDRIQMAYNNDPVPDESYNLFQNPIRDEYFSYMKEDSFPKEVDVEKTWYGVAKRKNLNRRNREMQTIPMEVVIPEPDDSTLFAGDEQMYAEMEVDSASLDSLRAANVQTYKYNVDQKYYLWYFRNKLAWEDELDSASVEETEASPESLSGPGTISAETDTTSQKKKGFLKGGLFKKKKNKEEPPVTDDKDKKEEVSNSEETIN